MHSKILIPRLNKFKKKLLFSKKNHFVFEAHSTDFQSLLTLKNLTKNNFKFLKVGPELTFSLSKAIFFMENLENKNLFKKKSNFTKNILITMNQNKKYWINYYKGSKKKINKLMLNSQLDRMRYYLSHKRTKKSKKILEKNINNLKKDLVIKFLNKLNTKNKRYILKEKNKLSNFQLIVSYFLETTLKKYYRACGFKI